MRILHICTSLEGGAGLCASRIINSTRKFGVEARALVCHGTKSETVDVIKQVYPWSKFWPVQKLQVLRNMRGDWPEAEVLLRKIEEEKSKSNKTICFTSPITLYKNLADHPWVKEADLVHLHWVGNFLDYESFFSKVKKPIVWTLHDENSGLGGFHYTMWKDGASDGLIKLDNEFIDIKQHAYDSVESMTLVAISTMMERFFSINNLLSRFSRVVIHNGIEGDNFTPISKDCARQALDLPKESKVFIFVAQCIQEDRKGLKELIEALEILKIPNTVLVCLGNYTNIPQTSFEIRCEGFVGNNRLQSLYYSAADFFVMPSYQEAFAQTPMEAMACGVPVIAFPCSGANDLINQDNGVVCDDFTVESLVKGIHLAQGKKFDSEKIREYVLNKFSYDRIARQYVELYESVLHHKS